LCATQLAPVITLVFNSSISQGKVPLLWKTSVIKPIPKTSNPAQPKDYRPIAITSCLGKILEKIIKNYIMQHTVLDKYQFAYRPGRSTQDALTYLLTSISSHIDQNSKFSARCLFLDYSSAFNTISIPHLLLQLNHLNSNVISWISSFLVERHQYTVVNKTKSDNIITRTGTPQGAVLSPVLFAIYTGVIQSKSPNIKILKYADDTVVLGLITCQEDTDSYIKEVHRIASLSKEYSLILNTQKTKEMLFSTKRVKQAIQPLHIDGNEIELSTSVKYLGVIIDDKLKFSEHCSAIVTKASQRLYIVNRLRSLGAHKNLLKIMHCSFIESVILYCIPVIFFFMYDKDRKCIAKFHKSAKKQQFSDHLFMDIVDKRLKSYALKIFLDDTHPIHDFINRLPSGRLQSVKFRSSIGKNSFLRHFILLINDTLFNRS
jgi:hypothetical protein